MLIVMNTLEILTKAFLLLGLFQILFLTSCAKKTPVSEPSHRRPQITRPSFPEQQEEAVYESSHSAPASAVPVQPIVSHPAAESLVNKGIQELSRGNYDSAEWNFEEAIRLSPRYGPAYYWMAEAKYKANDFDRARSFLNQAEALIGHHPDWQSRIRALKVELIGGVR